jgi:hypothetical protein
MGEVMSRWISSKRDMAKASASLGLLVASVRECLGFAGILGVEALDPAPSSRGLTHS